MVKKHYKNQGIMKFLTIIGALLGIVYLILALIPTIGRTYQLFPIEIGPYLGHWVVAVIIGFVVAIITLLAGVKPNDPIPFNWIMLFILAILMIIFVDILAGVLVLIAFLIGLIEEL
ncbi:MAG: hypothetical protein ACFE8M_08340 [Candidatus Hermodarchaeota archaeon]